MLYVNLVCAGLSYIMGAIAIHNGRIGMGLLHYLAFLLCLFGAWGVHRRRK